MKALVSACTRLASPWLTITSSAQGATSDQPYPATSPSSAVPAAIASETPIARGLASTGGVWLVPDGRAGPTSPGRAAPEVSGSSDIVASSVRDRVWPRTGARRRHGPARLLAWSD